MGRGGDRLGWNGPTLSPTYTPLAVDMRCKSLALGPN